MQKKLERISMDMLEVFISSMPHRMNVMICAKGGQVLHGRYVARHSQILVFFL